MRLSIRPRPEVTVRPEIRAIRPPVNYIDILSKSESDFRKYINEIESNPMFNRMLSDGAIRKIGFKGRIPSHVYQDFQDQQFIKFLQQYKITDKVEWESDFFDKKALRNVKQLSTKYKVARGELIKAIEYCRHLKQSWEGKDEEDYTAYISFDDPDNFHQVEDREYSASPDESIAQLAEIIEKHGISEKDFVGHFLSGNVDAFDVARKLDLDLNTVDQIMEAVEKVNIASSTQINVVEPQSSSKSSASQPIATVKRLKNPPRAEIQINADEEYSFRYRVKENDVSLNDEESLFIDKLKMINQRRSLTFRIVQFMFQFQYQYFASANPYYLKPLSQAEIAREVGEHESTISRILRDKHIEIDEGNTPLAFFCQSKEDIIQRIIQLREPDEINAGIRKKPFSDAEIADILENEYGVKVSRRTVTYYRNKTNTSPKFYKRSKTLRKDQNLS
jgi:transposase